MFVLTLCRESPVYLLTQDKPALETLSWYRETQEESKENKLETEREMQDLEFVF